MTLDQGARYPVDILLLTLRGTLAFPRVGESLLRAGVAAAPGLRQSALQPFLSAIVRRPPWQHLSRAEHGLFLDAHIDADGLGLGRCDIDGFPTAELHDHAERCSYYADQSNRLPGWHALYEEPAETLDVNGEAIARPTR